MALSQIVKKKPKDVLNRKEAELIHERLNLNEWIKKFPLNKMKKATDFSNTPTGPLPIAYVEQMRAAAKKAGKNLGKPVPVDLCIWKLGDSERRDVTKIGGVPFWPADEEWPIVKKRTTYTIVKKGTPCTFVAQFCFADSKDILPKLPGDILSILADDDDYSGIEIRWFKLKEKDLLPADKIPAQRWKIQPCHAVLHRTVEYPNAHFELFEKYPFPIDLWARRFTAGSKIGGAFETRGELYDPDEEVLKRYKEHEKHLQKTFFCQLGSTEATDRWPFVNVAKANKLSDHNDRNLLMISDVGGYDFFYDGGTTSYDSWSG